MRQKRAKSYRKQLLVYNHTFKFRQPYQVIVDDQIVTETDGSKYDLYKGLERTLQAEVKVMITQCCMQALYASGNQHAIESAKRYERRRCNHPPKDPKTPMECIESIVNINGVNKHRYIVACQDIDIRRKLRRVPGVPLVHLNRSVMVMEPLSDASAKISARMEQEKLYKGLNDPKYAGVVNQEGIKKEGNGEEKKQKKRKNGPKSPNPLSMKKKKPKIEETPSQLKVEDKQKIENVEGDGKKKRRRKHRSKNDSGHEEDVNAEYTTETHKESGEETIVKDNE